MAEKGILVEDAASGESVAARDASETDNDGNARIVQLTDQATRKNTMVKSSPLRSLITASDSFDLSTIPTDIINNAITVGDAASICVAVTYQAQGADHGVYITPIVIESTSDIAIALLEPKKFAGVNSDESDTYASIFSIGTADTNDIVPTIMQAWPVFGAQRIGFHVWLGASVTDVNIYACLCSDNAPGFTAIGSADLGGQFGLGQD